MNKMVGTAFLIIMLTMSALAGGAYLTARYYVDPSLKDLSMAITAIQPEAQKDLLPHFEELQRLREMANRYVPAALMLAGLSAMLICSVLFRRMVDQAADRPVETFKRPKAGIPPKKERSVVKSTNGNPMEIGACRILSILQHKARLIDFFQEEIAGYPDAQIGAAVRQIHEDCRKALHEYVTLAPVMSEREGEPVTVSVGFDPSEIRLTGHVTGSPPFEGVLQHGGWKVTRIDLPEQPKGQKHTVIAPAEVEMGNPEGETHI